MYIRDIFGVLTGRNSITQVDRLSVFLFFINVCFFLLSAVSNSQLIYKYAFITNKFRNQLSVKFHLMTSTSSRCGYNCFFFHSLKLFEQHFKIVLLDTRYYFNYLYITFTLTLTFTFTYRYSIIFWFYLIMVFVFFTFSFYNSRKRAI